MSTGVNKLSDHSLAQLFNSLIAKKDAARKEIDHFASSVDNLLPYVQKHYYVRTHYDTGEWHVEIFLQNKGFGIGHGKTLARAFLESLINAHYLEKDVDIGEKSDGIKS